MSIFIAIQLLSHSFMWKNGFDSYMWRLHTENVYKFVWFLLLSLVENLVWLTTAMQCNACVDIFISFIYYSFSSERSVQFVPCLSFHTVPHVFWCVQMGYSLGVDKRLAKSPITQSHHERLKWKFQVKMRLCAYATPHWCEFEFETWNYTEM